MLRLVLLLLIVAGVAGYLRVRMKRRCVLLLTKCCKRAQKLRRAISISAPSLKVRPSHSRGDRAYSNYYVGANMT